MTKVITNAKTGRMETVESFPPGDVQKELRRARQETKDFISGNVQFHTDELGPSPTEEEPQT